MITSSEAEEELPLSVRATRARAGVLLLILSDALTVASMLAAGGYLTALNVGNQFRGRDHAPAFLPSLLLTLGLVLSGLFYYLWEQRRQKNQAGGIFFPLALLLMAGALIGQIWLNTTLSFAAPFHAYASLILLLSWSSVVHLFLATLVGLLLAGRKASGRTVEHPYIIQAVGYWWYYTTIAAVLVWIFITALG